MPKTFEDLASSICSELGATPIIWTIRTMQPCPVMIGTVPRSGAAPEGVWLVWDELKHEVSDFTEDMYETICEQSERQSLAPAPYRVVGRRSFIATEDTIFYQPHALHQPISLR